MVCAYTYSIQLVTSSFYLIDYSHFTPSAEWKSKTLKPWCNIAEQEIVPGLENIQQHIFKFYVKVLLKQLAECKLDNLVLMHYDYVMV